MAIFIPQWERYQKPISGGKSVELDPNNHISDRITYFAPLFTGSLEVLGHGGLPLSAALESSGTDTTYLEWDDEGLRNTTYDGTYADGMGYVCPLGVQQKIYRTVGVQLKIVPGDYTNIDFIVLGDRDLNSDKSVSAYNGFAFTGGNNLKLSTSQSVADFGAAVIDDGQMHTYVANVSDGGSFQTALYIDGILHSRITSAKRTRDTLGSNVLIGSGSQHHNRGLNGVISSAFLVNSDQDESLAQALSENPYQILKPRRKFWVMPAAAGTFPGTLPNLQTLNRGYGPILSARLGGLLQ